MKTKLEKFITDNHEDLDKNIPNLEVLNRILQQMQVKAEDTRPAGIVIPFRALRWAAAALILLACGLAVYTLQSPKDTTVTGVHQYVRKTITRIQGDSTKAPEQVIAKGPNGNNIDEVDRDIAKQKNALMAKYNNNTAVSRKLVMLTSLKDMDSPARRITAVSQASEYKMAGRDIVTALLVTLNNDPNTNVRLAALDGLARFYRETYIRKQLIASLKKQQNPTVQIALIELLTKMKEAAVLNELDKIVASDSTITAVKDCAYSGIFKLRKS